MTAVESGEGVTGLREGLGDAMSRVAREFQEVHGDVEGTLQAITSAAARTIPHVDECGITYVIGRKKVEPRASTGDLPRDIDALQDRLGEGPCLDAIREGDLVRVDDVGADDRWPDFARDAAALGVGSMVCFRLFVEGDALGALNLYSRHPNAFDGVSEEVARVFTGHASVALAGAEHEENLRRGMDNRDVIGQAKGILMERHKLTAAQAFDVLARVSQEMNRKVFDVAYEVAETGEVPPPRSAAAP
jgi:GAF domain-containing protein